MAMTKAERQRMVDLEAELRLAKAFRWTDPVEPDVLPPENSFGRIRNGWDYNEYNAEVDKACTSAVAHGYRQWDETRSQRPRSLYSSRLLALRALRNALEKKYAKALAAVDEQIAREMQGETTEGE